MARNNCKVQSFCEVPHQSLQCPGSKNMGFNLFFLRDCAMTNYITGKEGVHNFQHWMEWNICNFDFVHRCGMKGIHLAIFVTHGRCNMGTTAKVQNITALNHNSSEYLRGVVFLAVKIIFFRCLLHGGFKYMTGNPTLTISHILTAEGDQTLRLANGTANPLPASSSLTHWNYKKPVFSEFYKYACEYSSQAKLQTSEFLQQIKKKINLFLHGWLASAKRDINESCLDMWQTAKKQNIL